MSFIIVKTTSHRAYSRVRNIPGAFGPYWKAGKTDSIMDRVDGEFWLVPEGYLLNAIGYPGAREAPRAQVHELSRFLFGQGSSVPSAIDVVEGRI